MDKIPTQVLGPVLLASSVATNSLIGMDRSLFLGSLVIGGAVTAYNLISRNKFNEAIQTCLGNEGISIENKEKKDYGYNVVLNTPCGVALSDFIEKKEAIEQYLNAEIDFTYRKGKINAIVKTKELLESYPFTLVQTPTPTSLVLGYSRMGLETLDLQDAHHLLISGETGAGKSVCLRVINTTLVLTKSPEELILHLVDFKRVELGIFKKCRLVEDFIYNEEELSDLLDRMAAISIERYQLFENHGLVNIQSYNRRFNPLPFHIVIIDEFAHLEDNDEIQKKLKLRIAVDRAAGIHYIICTQRPSHDILPGSLKANIPTKISFRTSTARNSEIILDMTGAELLPGKGAGLVKFDSLKRIQTMYLSETETQKLIKKTLVYRKSKIKSTEGVLPIGDGTGPETLRSNRKI